MGLKIFDTQNLITLLYLTRKKILENKKSCDIEIDGINIGNKTFMEINFFFSIIYQRYRIKGLTIDKV